MNILSDLWVLVRETQGGYDTPDTFKILGVFDSLDSAFVASKMEKSKWELLCGEYYISENIEETINSTVGGAVFLGLYKTKFNPKQISDRVQE